MRAREFENDIGLVKNIIKDGSEKARDIAEDTMAEVRSAMQLDNF